MLKKEEITINGIDVSECKNFYCGICEEENKIPRTIEHFTADCIFYPNCYFKQVKRLQEENKRLQMLSCANCGEKYLSPDGAELYEKNVQLQKENEGLKKENEELKTYIQKMDKPEIKTIDSEIALKNIELQQKNEELKNTPRLELDTSYIRKKELESIKYKQALEEIRQVVEFAIEETLTVSQKNGTSKILEIINEVFK